MLDKTGQRTCTSARRWKAIRRLMAQQSVSSPPEGGGAHTGYGLPPDDPRRPFVDLLVEAMADEILTRSRFLAALHDRAGIPAETLVFGRWPEDRDASVSKKRPSRRRGA